MTKQSVTLGLQTAALFTAVTPQFASAETLVQVDMSKSLHQQTIKAVSQSWLKVPQLCKAAAFHAMPVAFAPETRSAAINELYSF